MKFAFMFGSSCIYIYIYIPWFLGYAGLIFVCTSCGLCYIKSEKAL